MVHCPSVVELLVVSSGTKGGSAVVSASVSIIVSFACDRLNSMGILDLVSQKIVTHSAGSERSTVLDQPKRP